MTKLECSHCRCTLPISDWNQNITDSISLGRCDEYIPEYLTVDQWNEYKINNSGVVDCPECGDPQIYADMDAY